MTETVGGEQETAWLALIQAQVSIPPYDTPSFSSDSFFTTEIR